MASRFDQTFESDITGTIAAAARSTADAMLVGKPAPGSVQIADVQRAFAIKFGFDLSDVKITAVDVDLVFQFPDGSKLVLPGLALNLLSADPPKIAFNEEQVEPVAFFSKLGDVKLVDKIPALSLASAESDKTADGPGQGPGESEKRPITSGVGTASAKQDVTPGTPYPDRPPSPPLAQTPSPSAKAIPNASPTKSPPPEKHQDVPEDGALKAKLSFRLFGVTDAPDTGSQGDAWVFTNGFAAKPADTDPSLAAQVKSTSISGSSRADIINAADFSRVASGETMRRVEISAVATGREGEIASMIRITVPSGFRIDGVKPNNGYYEFETNGKNTIAFDLVYDLPGKDATLNDKGFYGGVKYLNVDMMFGTTAYSGKQAFVIAPRTENGPLEIALPDSEKAAVLWSNPPDVNVSAGAGDDTIYASASADFIDGGAGSDIVSYAKSHLAVQASLASGGTGGYAAGDTFRNVEGLEGSAFADRLTGDDKDNILIGGKGADTLDGGEGRDLADYSGATGAVSVDLERAVQIGGDAQGDVLISIEDVRGSQFRDDLAGDAHANRIWGEAGNDTIRGGGGNDTLDGGIGSDTLDYSDLGEADSVSVTLKGDDAAKATVLRNGASEIDTVTSFENVTGGRGNDTLIGDGRANRLVGGDGNDWLDGRGGGDTLDGGAGSDTVSYAYLNDGNRIAVALDGDGNATLQLFDDTGDVAQTDTLIGIENIRGGAGADTISGNDAANLLFGGGGNDEMSGGAGNDTLDGGTGADQLTGDGGDDVYIVDNAADRVIEHDGSGNDIVYATANYTLTGGSAVETLQVKDGVTTGLSLAGNERANTVIGSNGNDTLDGGAGADLIRGGAGDDLLIGGTGADTMAGGSGNDVYNVDEATDTVVEIDGEGNDTVEASVNYQLAAGTSVETLKVKDGFNAGLALTGNERDNTVLGGTGNDTLDGGAGSDLVDGGAGDDRLKGGAGADTLVGGDGNDVFVLSDLADTLVENANGGSDTVELQTGFAGPGYSLANTQIENLDASAVTVGLALTGSSAANSIKGGSGNDTIDGGAGSDTLEGGAGDDVLRGGSGDSLKGGSGNDIYEIDSAPASIDEAAGGGVDTVVLQYNPGSFTLGANLEILDATALTGSAILTGNETGATVKGGAGNDTIAGGMAADSLTGGAGNDVFMATLGHDTIDGGSGFDTVDYSQLGGQGRRIVVARDGATGNLVATLFDSNGAELKRDTLIGIEKIIGTDGQDILAGSANAETLFGGDGNDILKGDGSGDLLDGRAGTDTADYSALAAGAALTVALNAAGNGTATIAGVGSDQLASIENIIGGAGDDSITGNASANRLVGGLGNDRLDGGGGNDTLDGGAGDDLYIVNSVNETVNENVGGGYDVVRLSASFIGSAYTLADNVEELDASAISRGMSLTGNALANRMTGTAFNDSILGGLGNDTLIGGAGDDTLDGGAGNDSMQGGDGNDVYAVDSAADIVIEDSAAGSGTADKIVLATGFLVSAYSIDNSNVENLDATALSAALTLTGSADANRIQGGSGKNAIFGGGGGDTLEGGSSDDTLDGGEGNDSLDGGAGNDVLRGGAGTNILVGGSGNDVFELSTGTDTLNEDVNGGIDTVVLKTGYSGTAYSLAGTQIENIDASALTTNLSLTGSNSDNSIVGGSGNDTFDGGAGADTMAGGAGDDTYYVNNTGDVIQEVNGTGGGIDTVILEASFTGLSYTLNNLNVEIVDASAFSGALVINGSDDANKITGGTGNNSIIGGSGNDTLDGGGGNDTLIGGVGADSLIGGTGDDIFYVDNTDDVVVELSGVGSGTDKVVLQYNPLATGYTLANNVEILDASALLGNNALSGNAIDNTILAGSGNDIVSGSAGNDSLDGGGGINTLDYSYLTASTSSVNIDLAAGTANAGTGDIDTFVNFTHVNGGAGNDTLTGDANANSLSGAAGDDAISGRDGNDSLDGGDGNDTLDGGDGHDTLSGGAGDDLFFGSAGNDNFDGGTGTDTIDYSLQNGVTLALANSGSAQAAFLSSSKIDSVSSTVENIIGSKTQSNVLTGNEGANALTGGDTADILSGGAGNDTLNGGAGNDLLIGGTGTDLLIGGLGNDTFELSSASDTLIEDVNAGIDLVVLKPDYDGTSFTLANSNIENLDASALTAALTLTGSADDNSIKGGSGNDLLAGGGGNDTLEGGAGDDVLKGEGGTNSLVGGMGNDTYFVENASDIIVENIGAGSGSADKVVLQFDPGVSGYTLADNVEQLDAASLSGNNALTGNALANIILGGSGDDTIDGGAGNDTMAGGAGDDVYRVDSANDSVTENAGEGTDTIVTSVSLALSSFANVENLAAAAGASGLTLTGNAFANSIMGGAGNDTLDGGAGADTLRGGAGDDLYRIDAAAPDTIDETSAGSGGFDTVSVTFSAGAQSYTLGTNVENLRSETATALALTLTGNALANSISGSDGNDTLDGSAGDDTLDGGAGDDVLKGGSGNNSLIGGAGNDVYELASGNDIIVELANQGNDTVVLKYNATGFDLSGLVHVENLDASFSSADAALTGNAAANSITGGSGNDVLAGGAGNDTLNGGAGDDILKGEAGTNSLVGGAGNDTYYLDSAADSVVEESVAGSGTADTIVLQFDPGAAAYVLGQNIEILDGSARSGNNALTGNGLDNTLLGGTGNDTLYGGTGADSMAGGAGNDVYYVDTASDSVVEDSGAGSGAADRIVLQFNPGSTGYALAQNVEILDGSALSGNNALTGNALDNTMMGGTGNDTLDGGAGNDVLSGGAGNDTYVIDTTDIVDETSAGSGGTDTVSVRFTAGAQSFTLGSNLEHLKVETPTTLALTLTGNALANSISGSDGDDTLDGGASLDTLSGGAGNDTYFIDNPADQVIESSVAGSGTADTIVLQFDPSSTAYILGQNIEILDGSARSGNNALTGNGLDNTLLGGAGNDTLDGGMGADSMAGGDGNDEYYVDNADDIVTELANQGTDTVRTSVNYTLTNHVEFLISNSSDGLQLTGNALDNTIVGGAGNDTLDGGAGNDLLRGGAGNDTYIVDAGAADIVDESTFWSGGTDTVSVRFTTGAQSYTLGSELENLKVETPTTLALTLTGNALANAISGSNGDDTLDGGAGLDTLSGGAGNDTYKIDASAQDIIDETSAGSGGTDTVSVTFVAGSQSYTLGANLENLKVETPTTLALTLTGNALANSILGSDGNDTLDGGAGNDTLLGGAGNDVYNVDNVFDSIVEDSIAGSGAADKIVLQFNPGATAYVLAQNVEILDASALSGNNALTGNALDNSILGGSGNDVILGLAGNDSITGGAGNDTLNGGAGDDTLDGGAGTDRAVYSGDLVTGATLNYTFGFDVSNNLTVGGAEGNDRLTSIEQLSFNGSVFALQASITLNTTLTATSSPAILLASSGNDTLTGGTGNDILFGGAGNDSLNGGAGADTMVGGLGNDTYTVDNVNDVIIENTGEGTDSVTTSVSYTLGANLENLTGTGSTGLQLAGNALANSITGTTGNDTIIGTLGNDALVGAAGSDAVDYSTLTAADGSAIRVTLTTANQLTIFQISDGSTLGIQTLSSIEKVTGTSGNDVMAAAISGMTLDGGAGNDNLSGTTGNDTLIGGAGNDTLAGGNGGTSDSMDGGAGDDLYIWQGVGTISDSSGYDEIWIYNSLNASFANIEKFTVQSTGNYYVMGNDIANTMTGGTGIDTFNGGLGNDVISGGGNFDRVDYRYITGALTKDLVIDLWTVAANATVNAGSGDVDTLIGIYGAFGGDGNDSFTGTGANLQNYFAGGAGNDTFRGMGGVDTFDGGAGIDTLDLSYRTTGFTLTIAASVASNLGNDSVSASNFEDVWGGSGADNITGDANANLIRGGLGNDTLNGGTGNDTIDYSYLTANLTLALSAGGAQQTVTAAAGDVDTISNFENVTGGAGNDTITGNASDNILSGGTGNDSLTGGGGNDTLLGGLGNDVMILDVSNITGSSVDGGAGTDTFQFAAKGTSTATTVTLAQLNTLLDNTETIDLTGANNKITLNGSAAGTIDLTAASADRTALSGIAGGSAVTIRYNVAAGTNDTDTMPNVTNAAGVTTTGTAGTVGYTQSYFADAAKTQLLLTLIAA